jgi:hypothetical protein
MKDEKGRIWSKKTKICILKIGWEPGRGKPQGGHNYMRGYY